MPSTRIRTSPRISLNKLGEYLVAKPGRRHTIIREQREPKDFIVARYSEAERAIQEFITNGSRNAEQLERVIHSLSSSAYETDWKQQTAELCALALHAFKRIADNVPTNGFTPFIGEDSPEKMPISGVAVSVRPEILLRDTSNGNKIVGGLKIYLGKNTPLTDEAANFVASVLYRYLAEVLSTDAAVNYKNCFVLDVFAGKIFAAPKTYKRNMDHVAAACMEIETLWAAL